MSLKIKLRRLALIELIISVAVFIINYFFYHFVTDEGITLIWHAEAGKPFVTLFLGVFATAMISGSVISLLSAYTLHDGGEK